MTFHKNIISLCTNRRFISQRVLFVPIGLLFAVGTVNLQSCPASTVSLTTQNQIELNFSLSNLFGLFVENPYF